MRIIAALSFSAFVLPLTLHAQTPIPAQTLPPFQVEEASIAEIHAAFRAGRLTCRGLVERYLRRIDAYDKNGPAGPLAW